MGFLLYATSRAWGCDECFAMLNNTGKPCYELLLISLLWRLLLQRPAPLACSLQRFLCSYSCDSLAAILLRECTPGMGC